MMEVLHTPQKQPQYVWPSQDVANISGQYQPRPRPGECARIHTIFISAILPGTEKKVKVVSRKNNIHRVRQLAQIKHF